VAGDPALYNTPHGWKKRKILANGDKIVIVVGERPHAPVSGNELSQLRERKGKRSRTASVRGVAEIGRWTEEDFPWLGPENTLLNILM